MSVLFECPLCHKKQSLNNKRCTCGIDLDKAKCAKKPRYWVDFYVPHHGRRREFVGNSKKEADDAMGKRKSQKRENRFFDMLPGSEITFAELADWYLNLEKTKKLKSYHTVKVYLDKFIREFGSWKVADIKPADLENLQVKRQSQGLKDKTVDDELNYAKTMVIKGYDNGKVAGESYLAFKRIGRLLKRNSNRRQRVLSIQEFTRLVEASPRHLKDILTVAYWTGMRKGEITALTWEKIDLKRRMIRLTAEDTKEAMPKSVPMARAVMDVLAKIPRGIHGRRVFLYYGRPITRNFSQGLKSACKKAGILWGRDVPGGFIFHDLRHTFITDARKAGVDRTVRMTITGHIGRDMDFRYDVVDDEDKHVAVRLLEEYRSSQAAAALSDQTVTKSPV